MYPHPCPASALVTCVYCFFVLFFINDDHKSVGGGAERSTLSAREHVCLSVCYCYQTTIANRSNFRLGAVLILDNALLPGVFLRSKGRRSKVKVAAGGHTIRCHYRVQKYTACDEINNYARVVFASLKTGRTLVLISIGAISLQLTHSQRLSCARVRISTECSIVLSILLFLCFLLHEFCL